MKIHIIIQVRLQIFYINAHGKINEVTEKITDICFTIITTL